jgi:phosphomevalonate kinase
MILALAGKRKCGKTTVADMINEIKKEECAEFSFAGALKDAFALENKIDRSLLDDVVEKERYRAGVQQLSEVWKEKFGEDIFARMVMDKIDIMRNSLGMRNMPVFITDLRFWVELATMKDYDKPQILMLKSLPHVRRRRGWVESEVDKHASETEVADMTPEEIRRTNTLVLYNNCEMAELRPQVEDLLWRVSF